MSTITYYNFINTDKASHLDVVTNSIASQRQSNSNSPESCATSPSDSSSSLNQFNSSTPTSSSSSSAAYSLSASATPNTSFSVASATSVASRPKQQASLINNSNNLINNRGNNISQNNLDLQRQTSITPTIQLENTRHQHSQLSHSYTLHSLEPRPMKPFKSRSAYIEAMKEDLSEWLNRLYPDLELNVDNFFSQLETGAIICRHANNVTQMGRNSMLEQLTNESGNSGSNDNSLTHETSHQHHHNQNASLSSLSPDCEETQQQQQQHLQHIHHNQQQHQYLTNTSLDQHHHMHLDMSNQPLSLRHRHSTTNSSISSIATNSSTASRQRLSLTGSNHVISSARNERPIDWFRVKMIPYKVDARAGTFFARDNICQFILWCRSLCVRECLLFETDDLVARKNEKSFILCLLEIARIGFKVGMPTPLIIQLEQEIDREIEQEAKLQRQIGEEQGNSLKELEASEISCGNFDDDHESSNDNNNNNKANEDNDGEPSEEKRGCAANDVLAEDEEECKQNYGPKPQVITNDLLSLHEKVSEMCIVCRMLEMHHSAGLLFFRLTANSCPRVAFENFSGDSFM